MDWNNRVIAVRLYIIFVRKRYVVFIVKVASKFDFLVACLLAGTDDRTQGGGLAGTRDGFDGVVPFFSTVNLLPAV